MKILVLNYEFPPVGGGGGRIAETLCRAMARKGHHIRVQTAHVRGLPPRERRDGCDIFRGFAFRRDPASCSIPEMGGFILGNLIPALEQAAAWKPDVVHVHFAVPTGPLAFCIRKIHGIPYVLTAHLGDVPGGVPDQTDAAFRWIKPFTVPVWKQAAAVTAVSGFTQRLAEDAYGVDVNLIPNGIDLSSCRQSPARPGAPPRLVFAGRLNPQKNLLFFMDVLGRVKDLNWRLDLCGDGPLMAALQSKIRDLRLGDKLRLHGWVASERVNEIMAESDVLVLPSLSEGMSIVNLQALGCGLAVLGSRIPGVMDLVRHGENGLLCPPDDPACFAEALAFMVRNPDALARMKRAGRERASQFDLGRITAQYEALFEKAARSRVRRA